MQAQLAIGIGFRVLRHVGADLIIDMQRMKDADVAFNQLQAQAVFFVHAALVETILAEVIHHGLFDHIHHMFEPDPGTDVVALDPGVDRRGSGLKISQCRHWSVLRLRKVEM